MGCTDKSNWAVGIASAWKNREKAAKLALALTFVESESKVVKLARTYSGFGDLAIAAQLMPDEPDRDDSPSRSCKSECDLRRTRMTRMMIIEMTWLCWRVLSGLS